MHILNRYIRNAVISSTLVVVLILVALESFGQFIAQLSDIGKAHYGIVQALIYVPSQLPVGLYMLFPVAGFIGCLIGLGRLATGCELTVMRAAGVSISKVLWSVIKAALWMLLVVTIIGEFVAPKLQVMGNNMKNVAMDRSHLNNNGRLWLQHNNKFVFIDEIASPKKLVGITEFQFNGDRRLQSTSFATNATLEKGRWVLHNIQGTRFRGRHTAAFSEKSAPLGLTLKPKRLKKYNNDSMGGSVFNLWKTIHYRQEAGLVTSLFKLTFWQRVIQPLTTLVMICLGVPFIFGSLRSVSMSVRIMTGIAIGFGFYMLNRFFGPVTLLYQFPAFWAAVIPTAVFFIIYCFMIRRIA